VAGREPLGLIPPDAYHAVRDELADVLAAIPDPDGNSLNTSIFRPEQIYSEVRSVAPDLMVYFGDLHWRAVGSLGHTTCYTLENDTGPDDANHATQGLFILYEPGRQATEKHGSPSTDGRCAHADRLRLPVPADMGRIIGT
jgi:predicted AlkP superfamily phosphohydrolase/phosphomutase